MLHTAKQKPIVCNFNPWRSVCLAVESYVFIGEQGRTKLGMLIKINHYDAS